jgi:hypothetical protein
MSEVVTASNGQQLDLDNLPQTFNYTADQLTSIVITLNGKTYTQTFTWSGTNIATISGWMAS